MQIMWYKQFKPSAFYCALLTQYGKEVNDFDYFEVFNCETLDELKLIEKKYSIGKQKGDVSIKFKTRLADLIFEAKLRGFHLVPTNLYSHYSLFTPNPIDEKEIFMPLTSLAGVAELTAKKIYESFKVDKYTSYEDLLERKCDGNRKIFNKTTLQGLGLFELQPEQIALLNSKMSQLNSGAKTHE